jgi:hypothetical protein
VQDSAPYSARHPGTKRSRVSHRKIRQDAKKTAVRPERATAFVDAWKGGSSDFMPDQWDNFFVMVGGGAAALAGLIFVAMSVNPEVVIRNSTHKNRAINMLSGFSAVFMACSFALIGRQYLEVLGFEWLVLWLAATVIFIRGYVVAIRSGMSSIGLTMPRLAGGTICYLAEVIGAILLILGNSAGLYIAAIASIVLFAFLISGAWLLIIGVYEDPTR